MPEEWRPIPSLKGYFASSLGRIRGPRGIRKAQVAKRGYLVIEARDSTHQVSRLVCEAFWGAPPTEKHQAAHWNGVVTDNYPENLRWTTAMENCHDRKRNGVWQELEKHPRARLTLEQVRRVKAMYADRGSTRYIKRGTRAALAEEFGVSVSLIKDIVGGRSWLEA